MILGRDLRVWDKMGAGWGGVGGWIWMEGEDLDLWGRWNEGRWMGDVREVES